jgi:hypothetical protein
LFIFLIPSCPKACGTGITLKAGFVSKPNLDIGLVHQLLELLQKSFAQLLILFVWPGLWQTEHIYDNRYSIRVF